MFSRFTFFLLAAANGEKLGRWDSPFFCLDPPAEGVELGFDVLGFFPFCFFLACFEASSFGRGDGVVPFCCFLASFGGGDGFVSAVLYSDCSEVLSSVGKISI